jgi:hypothetical protein
MMLPNYFIIGGLHFPEPPGIPDQIAGGSRTQVTTIPLDAFACINAIMILDHLIHPRNKCGY